MKKYILGISCFYHDSAAAILRDGEIVAAAQEERFTRLKNDASFPVNAIQYCLSQCKISISEVQEIIFYENPTIKFKRICITTFVNFPRSLYLLFFVIPSWLIGKLYWKRDLQNKFKKFFNIRIDKTKFYCVEHHRSHAASAYFPSQFKDAAVLVVDGVGEMQTISIWHGKDNKLTLLHSTNFPHSIGLLYSAFTFFAGFKVNSGEYKVMGLAPYGNPKYENLILNNLILNKRADSFKLNMNFFSYSTSRRLINKSFEKLFGFSARKRESALGEREMDLASSIQNVTNSLMLEFAKMAFDLTGSKNLCMAGGVALNCVANGEILRSKIYKNIWIQPAAGDAGGALGCALSFFHETKDNPLKINSEVSDLMKGSLLGPSYSNVEVKNFLDSIGATYEEIPNSLDYCKSVASLIKAGNVVGWHQGRMEFGPRALGARSILGDPQNSKMQSIMNLKIKFRESFRPFAPSVLLEKSSEYFELDSPSPYMLLVAPIKNSIRLNQDLNFMAHGIDKLNIVRSSIPAVTHLDYSARIQTVEKSVNEKYWTLINEFYKVSGCPVLINSSFNVRGEPIVCTPKDSYLCFMRTEMDVLAIEGFLLRKEEQKSFGLPLGNWETEFELD